MPEDTTTTSTNNNSDGSSAKGTDPKETIVSPGKDPKPTSTETTPDPKDFIPKHRFDEQGEELRELKKFKAEQEAKAKAAEEEQLKKKGEWEQLAANAKKEAEEARTALATERINNKIIVAAQKAGVIDTDAALALIDRSKIVANEDGSISGIDEAIKSLTESKSYLVKNGDNTTVGSGTNPGQGSTDSIKKFKHSQLLDPKFFAEHEKEIEKAMKLGLIEDDLQSH